MKPSRKQETIGSTESEKKPRKPRSSSKAKEIDELKKRISELETAILSERGKSISNSLNFGTYQRKAVGQLTEFKNLLTMERKRNECLSFAFGEFRCRELLWLASQWMRNANFNLKVGGKQMDRRAVLQEIDSFLANFTFQRKK